MPDPAPGTLDPASDDHEPAAIARVAALSLVDGGVVLYDTENHRAWIQADVAVDLAA